MKVKFVTEDDGREIQRTADVSPEENQEGDGVYYHLKEDCTYCKGCGKRNINEYLALMMEAIFANGGSAFNIQIVQYMEDYDAVTNSNYMRGRMECLKKSGYVMQRTAPKTGVRGGYSTLFYLTDKAYAAFREALTPAQYDALFDSERRKK